MQVGTKEGGQREGGRKRASFRDELFFFFFSSGSLGMTDGDDRVREMI